jgi:stage V sporulation protein R
MLIDQLYHPPSIEFYTLESGALHLNHEFEGKILYRDYIDNVLVGLEYLWGDKVILETTEFEKEEKDETDYDMYVKMMMGVDDEEESTEYKKVKVLYTCKDRKVKRLVM